jgi:hypothetical protein
VAAEMGESQADLEEQRELMKLSRQDAKDHFCQKCHDLDNSPEFLERGFEAYWAEIEHIGKD